MLKIAFFGMSMYISYFFEVLYEKKKFHEKEEMFRVQFFKESYEIHWVFLF